MSTPKHPGDLLLNFTDRPEIPYVYKLTFQTWGVAYDKGANAGVVFEVITRLTNGGNNDDNRVESTIKMKHLDYGMTYADLMELSDWAKRAAAWVKHKSVNGKYGASFDPNEKEVCSIIPDKE